MAEPDPDRQQAARFLEARSTTNISRNSLNEHSEEVAMSQEPGDGSTRPTPVPPRARGSGTFRRTDDVPGSAGDAGRASREGGVSVVSAVQGKGLVGVVVAQGELMRDSIASLLESHGLAVRRLDSVEWLFAPGVLEGADVVFLAVGCVNGGIRSSGSGSDRSGNGGAMDAIEACRRLRSDRGFKGGVIIVSSDDRWERRAAAYLACTDHYLLDRELPELLLATVTGLSHRLEHAGLLRRVRFGDIVLDPDERRVTVKGERRRVSKDRFDVLCLLISEPGIPHSVEKIAHLVGSNPRAARRMVNRLAHDLGPSAAGVIETVRGLGFGVGLNARRLTRK